MNIVLQYMDGQSPAWAATESSCIWLAIPAPSRVIGVNGILSAVGMHVSRIIAWQLKDPASFYSSSEQIATTYLHAYVTAHKNIRP